MLLNADAVAALNGIESETIDSLVTDPPAGISFMNKDWDSKANFDATLKQIFVECLRVLKPGAHGLVWAIPRTSHKTAQALEDAGFEIRDVITHIFGSGFPKSLDMSKAIDKMHGAEREVIGIDESRAKRLVNQMGEYETEAGWKAGDRTVNITVPATPEAKQWSGFGTALKPASEHWILVRKPLSEDTIAKNVLKHATGGLNIDISRIAHNEECKMMKAQTDDEIMTGGGKYGQAGRRKDVLELKPNGRFPANLVLSHNDDCDEQCTENCAVKILDGQSGVLKSGALKAGHKQGGSTMYANNDGTNLISKDYGNDSGGASRFFYCAKASKKDRGIDNKHPTVKSTKLMEYLIKLVTPPDGIVLDPFMGSGSTGVAAQTAGFKFIGIEKEQEYFEIAQKRLLNAL